MELDIITDTNDEFTVLLFNGEWFAASNIVWILCVFIAFILWSVRVDLLFGVDIVSVPENTTINLFNQYNPITMWTLDICHFSLKTFSTPKVDSR